MHAVLGEGVCPTLDGLEEGLKHHKMIMLFYAMCETVILLDCITVVLAVFFLWIKGPFGVPMYVYMCIYITLLNLYCGLYGSSQSCLCGEIGELDSVSPSSTSGTAQL